MIPDEDEVGGDLTAVTARITGQSTDTVIEAKTEIRRCCGARRTRRTARRSPSPYRLRRPVGFVDFGKHGGSSVFGLALRRANHMCGHVFERVGDANQFDSRRRVDDLNNVVDLGTEAHFRVTRRATLRSGPARRSCGRAPTYRLR